MATETARGGRPATSPPTVSEHLTIDDRVGLLRDMLLMRGIEERAMTALPPGQGARAPSTTASGRRRCRPAPRGRWPAHDRLCVLHRDLAAHLVRGVTPARIFAQYMGREGGVTGGRDGNVHFGDRTLGCVGMVSMLPDMMLVATGMAMAFKLRGEQRCALTWFGDGSTSRGDFHEAMNWAGVQQLPVIFVLENNQYAYSTPLDKQFAVDPVHRAEAYGFPGISRRRQRRRGDVRGHAPGARARAGRRGPDADRGRDHAHARPRRARRHEVRARRADRGVAAQGPDRPPGAPARGARRRRRGGARGGRRPRSTPPSRRRWRCRCPTARPRPSGVFADEPALLEDGQAPWCGFAERLMPTMTYLQAISDAMREEMRADERVFVMGEDIGVFGGAFKVTDGFIDEFGPTA